METNGPARAVTGRTAALPALAEVFRTHGYEGASLALISARTGLGKGSLYNFFPGGKEEMATAVLAEIEGWFEAEVFAPLRRASDPKQAIVDMLAAVERYFESGRRVCLVGAFALADTRDLFAGRVHGYFREWVDALAVCIGRRGIRQAQAIGIAEEAVALIQGALILSRALDDPGVFSRALESFRQRLIVGWD